LASCVLFAAILPRTAASSRPSSLCCATAARPLRAVSSDPLFD
jgi:hypothetical protein